MEITRQQVKPVECIVCHSELNMAIGMGDDRSPKPGDGMVCMHCGTVYALTEDSIRRLTPQELHALQEHARHVIHSIQNSLKKDTN